MMTVTTERSRAMIRESSKVARSGVFGIHGPSLRRFALRMRQGSTSLTLARAADPLPLRHTGGPPLRVSEVCIPPGATIPSEEPDSPSIRQLVPRNGFGTVSRYRLFVTWGWRCVHSTQTAPRGWRPGCTKRKRRLRRHSDARVLPKTPENLYSQLIDPAVSEKGGIGSPETLVCGRPLEITRRPSRNSSFIRGH